jgi:hypothetical protein
MAADSAEEQCRITCIIMGPLSKCRKNNLPSFRASGARPGIQQYPGMTKRLDPRFHGDDEFCTSLLWI